MKSVKESRIFDRNNYDNIGLSRHQSKFMFDEERADIDYRDASNTTYRPLWKKCPEKEPK